MDHVCTVRDPATNHDRDLKIYQRDTHNWFNGRPLFLMMILLYVFRVLQKEQLDYRYIPFGCLRFCFLS